MYHHDDADEFSDLSEVSEDDYEAGPKSRKKSYSSAKAGAKSGKGASSATGGFKIKNALKVPRPTTYTVQALYDQIHSCDINLEPDYQRDVVWPEAKQIGIIDSIFRNFYIPPVIFAVNSFEDGSETRTCIDGKQRLTSMYRFMDGLIPHKDPFTGEKLWYKDVGPTKGARSKKLLPEKYRRLFANKQIVCVEYHDITNQDEREIFQRVQLGMALTPAEKLQVINSSRAQFIRELQSDYLKEDSGGLNTSALDWDRTRGADFRCLAQSIYIIDKYSPTFKTAPTILQLEKWLSDEAQPLAEFKKRIADTFDIFVQLVYDKGTKTVFKNPAKVSPVEFVLIVVLVAICKDTMNLAELSAAIGGMRDDVREYHADIRMNTKVTKTMLDYIRGLKPGKTPTESTAGYLVSKAPTSTGKRKRDDKMDVDGDTNESESEAEPLAAGNSTQSQPIKKPRGTTTPVSTTATDTSKMSTPPKIGPPRSSKPISAVSPPRASAPAPLPLPAPPRNDRLAGVRAARAAAANAGGVSGPSSSTSTSRPPLKPNAVNVPLQSPRIPTALPSPGLPFAGFKGGLGVAVPQSPSQPFAQPPNSLPSQHTNALPLPAPSQINPPRPSGIESLLQSYVSPLSQNPSQSQGVGATNPNPSTGGSGRETEIDRREREKRERVQWELGRYGRIQRSDMGEDGNGGGSGGGNSRGGWGGSNGVGVDNGWSGRRSLAK